VSLENKPYILGTSNQTLILKSWKPTAKKNKTECAKIKHQTS